MLLFARYEASDPSDIEVVTREFIERYGAVSAELYSQPLFTNPELLADYVQATTATGQPGTPPQEPSPAAAPTPTDLPQEAP